ncbi:MAG: chitobiase/beta-hexosaminidase C-terminal domain-containing protein [Bacillota bacterium]
MLRAKKITHQMLVLLLIFSLIITCMPSALYANQYDITTVAGIVGESGPFVGGVATSAYLANPIGVASDSSSNLYILDTVIGVCVVDTATGIISALLVGVGSPRGVAVDAAGSLYISGETFNIVKCHDGETNSVLTGHPPGGLAVDSSGSNIYFIDRSESVVYKVYSDGTVADFAGSGTDGYSGDGGPATSALLNNPEGIAVDSGGNLYIADTQNNVIRKVYADGTITTFAGNYAAGAGYDEDGVAATSTRLNHPAGVAVDSSGNLYIADTGNHRIRRVDTATGIITTVAGNGTQGSPQSGVAATSSSLNQPTGVAIGGDGNLYIANTGSNSVHMVRLVPYTNPAAPVITPSGGAYASAQSVSVGISAALSGGQTIYYTIDGTSPAVTSAVYSSPFTLTLTAGTTTVKAAVYDAGTGLWSSTATATFTVNQGGGSTPLPPPQATAPLVATVPATGITLNQATLNGSITSDGGTPCTQANFRFRLIGDYNWQETITQFVSLGSGAQFSALVTGLKPNAKYEFEARACNAKGWGEGQIFFFTTTSAALPKVVTSPATGVNVDTATLNGAITDNGGADIADSGFLWGTFDQLGKNMNKVHVPPGSGGSLTFNLNGLEKNTKYYFYSYATNAAGSIYGDLLSFETPLVPPVSATTLEATDVGFVTATLHGRITGGDGDTAVGFSVSPGFKDLYTYTKPAADGSFSLTVNGLTPGVKYNFTAFAMNKLGKKFYAPSGKDFITLTNAPEVNTQSPAGITSTTAVLKGFIKKNHGFEVTESGFLWGGDPKPDKRVSVLPGGDGRTLSYSLKDLQGGATYYVQAYAVNSEGTGYGSTEGFTTQPATTPAVTTAPAVFDAVSGGAVFKGSIASNGGAPITEYGFRYGTDQKSWTNLVMGQEHTGVFTSEGIYRLDNLSPGVTYYVQAYAVNQVGPGYGEAVSLALPRLPVVTGSIDKTAIKSTSATLAGNITDTGGAGVNCSARQFQYRLAGSKDWVDAGSEQGSFGPGTFSLSLTGLKPGTRYEFRARAQNPVGWGDSEAVAFATSFGLTDKEAAVNMKAAGLDVVKIANELQSVYRDTAAAALEALQYAGFGANDIALALKNSSYRCSLQTVVGLLKSAGFDVVAVAGVLQQVFPQEVKWNGHLDLGVALCLKNSGYSIDEVITAMRAVFNYQLADCASKLAGGGSWFSYDTVYGGIARVYGATELANYLWSTKDKWARIDSNLGYIARIMRDNAGLDALQVAGILKGVYPSLDMKLLAQVFRNVGYSPGDAGSVLMQNFAAGLPAVFQTLINVGYDQNDLAGLMDWTVNSMHCSPQQMALILTNWDNSWDKIAWVFTTYYHMDAVGVAKTLYGAGWTENSSGRYKLNDLVELISRYLGKSSAFDIIGVLKEMGLSPLVVADIASSKGGHTWLSAYRQQGYTATDAAAWYNYKEPYTSRWARAGWTRQAFQLDKAGGTIVDLAKRGGYSLNDIALAIRCVYELDQNTALDLLKKTNRGTAIGWADGDIVKAVSLAYGVDPIPGVIRGMKNSGAPVTQVACSLKQNFGVSDPLKLATYLDQSGYGQNDVLSGLLDALYQGKSTPEAFRMLTQVLQSLYRQKQDDIAALLQAAGVTTPEAAIPVLNQAGYNLNSIAQILKDVYNVTASGATAALLNSGYYKQSEVGSAVQLVFGGDHITVYLQYLKSQGNDATACYERLTGMMGAKDPSRAFLYLKEVYSEGEALEAVLFYARDDVLLVLKNAYGLSDPVALGSQLKQMPRVRDYYGQYSIASQLRKVFPGVSTAAVAKSLLAAGITVYEGNGIFTWLRSEEENGQRDDELAAILGSAHPGDLNLKSVHTAEILRYKGYSLEETASWLKKDNYALVDIIDALNAQWQEQGLVAVINVLKKQGCSIDDLAGGLAAFMGLHSDSGFITRCSHAYSYLISAGYSLADTAGAFLKLGVGVTDMVSIMGDYSIGRSIEEHNPTLRLSAADIGIALYTAGKNRPELSLSLVDIAGGLNAHAIDPYNMFTRKAVLEGMKRVGGKYLEDEIASGKIQLPFAINLNDLKVTDGSALCTLRLAGLSIDDAVTTLKEAGYGWSDALGTLLVAGYSTGDSVSALWNSGYRNAIGADIINLMSNAGKMAVDPGIFSAIKAVGQLAYTGFKIGTAN